jgi:pimeloyl-ACP methyl ester carboxylesterase
VRFGPPIVIALVALLCATSATARVPVPTDEQATVQRLTIHYRAHDGRIRKAIVLAPANIDPRESLPLIISPHGRGVDGEINSRLWGDLPGRYGFIVVNPDGQGRKLGLYSWGWRGDIDDLARMPEIVARALPRLHVDRQRIYAFGGSMGGQEALLLVALHPDLLAGVAAFDPATDMAERYRAFVHQPFGTSLQEMARKEIGGTPAQKPRAYAERSPDHYVRQIADSGVRMQIWWSTRDRIIRDQAQGAGRLFREIKELNPLAPVEQCKGMWDHTVEMEWNRRLPHALGFFGLRRQDHSGVESWGHRPPPEQ